MRSRKNALSRSYILGLLLLVSACGASNGNSEALGKLEKTDDKPLKVQDLSKQNNVPKNPTEIMNRGEQVEYAKQDLANRFDIAPDKIQLLTAETVTWRSGALGCPEPGNNYTQALVLGVLIVLGADSKHYRYHGKKNGVPEYCPNAQAESPATAASDI